MIKTTLSRRGLLAGTGAAAAAGLLSGTALAKAPLLNKPAPAFYRFKVGTIEATVISDGPMATGPVEKTFFGPTADELKKMMADRFVASDNVLLDQNALVINTGDKLALFETGMSSVKRSKDMGKLVENMKAAGIDPKDIDAVIPSHGHIDHIGGILAEDGSRNFPNAQNLHCAGRSRILDRRGGAQGHAGRRLDARGTQEPAAEPRPHHLLQGRQGGHSRRAGHGDARPPYGHTGFIVNSGNQTLFVGGDLVHHDIIIEKPRMEDAFDTDRKMAIETRVRTMGMLSSQKLLSLIYHTAWPGLGHFSTRGDGFRFEPIAMDFRS